MLIFPAGGPNDVVGRLLGQWLSERLGQPFIIENRSGAGGTVGTEVVVRAAPDGYTLLQVNTPNAINATLYDNLSYNFIRDIVPVASIIRTPLVMEVNPSFPAKTVPEFIAFAKANPGKINMASGGNGTPGHVAGELFKMMAGVSMVHVPYRGGALALTDLLGGQVQVLIDPIPASIGYLRAGKLRALAVTTTTAWTCSQTSQPSTNSSRATRQVLGTASARPEARLPKLSTGSIQRSMLTLPTPLKDSACGGRRHTIFQFTH